MTDMELVEEHLKLGKQLDNAMRWGFVHAVLLAALLAVTFAAALADGRLTQ